MATEKSKITSFPTESLAQSISLVKKMIDQRGDQSSTLKQIAIATGIGEGTLPLPLSTAVQYGVLVSGSGYKSTPLYHRIQSPTFEYDKDLAIYEALSSPPLYKKILEDFNGRQLPTESGLANYLTQNFGFKAYAIPKIIRSFFLNFKSSIDANNKLRFAQPQKKDGTEPILENVEPKKPIPENEAVDLKLEVKTIMSLFEQPVPMPNAKMIVLKYPKGNMDKGDFVALRSFIDFLELTEVRGTKEIKENE